MKKITEDMLVGEIVRDYPQVIDTLLEIGMHCLGCPSSQAESIADAAYVHGLDKADVVNRLNKKLEE